MLSTKQRAKLKSIASTYDAILQVGKNGINDNLIIQVSDALKKRELIKISVLDNCLMTAKELAHPIADMTESEVVQVIGSKIVLYKVNKKEPVISPEIKKIK
jgi:RNA-binding protein